MKIKSLLYEKSLAQKLLYPMSVKRYIKQWAQNGPRVKGNGINIVIINHCYDQDIDAICAAATGNENIWVLESSKVFKIVHTFIPKQLSDKNLPNEDPAVAPMVRKYTERFIKPLANFMNNTAHPHILLTPSDVFFWIRPLLQELKQRGAPIVVQDKEGTICPSPIMDMHADFIKKTFPPISDWYIYWNKEHFNFAHKMGVPVSKGFILGQPRSDYFFHPERWISRKALGIPPDAKVILFYTFAADAYTDTGLIGSAKEKPWRQLRKEIMSVFKKVAMSNTNAYLVVKAHPQQNDLWENLEEFKKMNYPRAKFAVGAHSSNAFAVNADIVVGFQTTAIIEAMLMNKPIIYTGWGEMHNKLSKELLPIHTSGACAIPKNATEFETLLLNYLANPEVPAYHIENRVCFKENYFHGSDGQVSRRILDFLHNRVNCHGNNFACLEGTS